MKIDVVRKQKRKKESTTKCTDNPKGTTICVPGKRHSYSTPTSNKSKSYRAKLNGKEVKKKNTYFRYCTYCSLTFDLNKNSRSIFINVASFTNLRNHQCIASLSFKLQR